MKKNKLLNSLKKIADTKNSSIAEERANIERDQRLKEEAEEKLAIEKAWKYFKSSWEKHIEHEAQKGLYRTNVYRLGKYDVPYEDRGAVERPGLSGLKMRDKTQLMGAAAKIFNLLEKEGLNPRLNFSSKIANYDSDGMHDRYHFVDIEVDWSENKK